MNHIIGELKMPSVNKQQSRIRVAKEFKKNHSKEKLQYLLQGLQAGLSGQTLADSLGVSRERVRQWKNTFGDEIYVFNPKKLVVQAQSGKKVADRTINNFINTRGLPAFKKFISDLVNRRSGEKIAQQLGVSRQRVRQLKTKFGTTYRVYNIHPEVIAQMNRK